MKGPTGSTGTLKHGWAGWLAKPCLSEPWRLMLLLSIASVVTTSLRIYSCMKALTGQYSGTYSDVMDFFQALLLKQINELSTTLDTGLLVKLG